jgi:hypothetical protein
MIVHEAWVRLKDVTLFWLLDVLLNSLRAFFSESLEKLEKHLHQFHVTLFLWTLSREGFQTHLDPHLNGLHWIGDHVRSECGTTDDDHLSDCGMENNPDASAPGDEGSEYATKYD